MKKKILVLGVLIFTASFAQAQKVGYTNVEYVLSALPETKTMESELKTQRQQFENLLQGKMKEYEEKVKTYEKDQEMLAKNDVMKADREKEIQSMQTSIREFQSSADKSLQKKQGELLSPVLSKIQKAIDEVAKESGFAYVFNTDAGNGTTPILLHAPQENNVSDLVLKKLGVDPEQLKKQAATTPKK